MSKRVFISELIIDHVIMDIGSEPFLAQDDNYYTIITGRNGSGKSRVLEAISFCILLTEFLPAEQERVIANCKISSLPNELLPTIPFKSISMSYYIGSKLNKVEIKDDSITCWSIMYDKNTCHPKLICLSNSLFNRFLAGYGKSMGFPLHDPDKYKNLSIYKDVKNSRTFSNSDFVSDVLSREIIKLFFMGEGVYSRSISFMRNFEISGDIFLSLKVEWRICGATMNGITDVERLKQSIKGILGYENENDEYLVSELSAKLGKVLRNFSTGQDPWFDEIGDDHHFTMNQSIAEFTFNENTSFPIELCEDILYLSEYGVLLLKDFKFNRKGVSMDLHKMSSGEINIFMLLIKVNSEIENDSIIMIDEPEISLHPAWQNEVLPSLEACFSQYNGCHFIIATHSPQVVASIPSKNSCVVMLDNSPNTVLGEEVRGKSSDFQLFHTLNYAGGSNEYLIKRLLTIIAKIDTSTPLDDEDNVFIQQTSIMLDDIKNNDMAKYLLIQTLVLLDVSRIQDEQ